MKTIVNSERDAIYLSGLLTRAAGSVQHDPLLHDIEQVSLASEICGIRDNIEIQPEDPNRKERVERLITRTNEELLKYTSDKNIKTLTDFGMWAVLAIQEFIRELTGEENGESES